MIVLSRLILTAALFWCPAEAQNTPWDLIFSSPLTAGSNWGVSLGDSSIFEKNEIMPFPMASVSKLYIAASALESLGSEYQFETLIRWRNSPQKPSFAYEMTLIGSGDPSWGMMEFGSGTIVSSTDDEAIILTCAHIFHVDGVNAVGKFPINLKNTY